MVSNAGYQERKKGRSIAQHVGNRSTASSATPVIQRNGGETGGGGGAASSSTSTSTPSTSAPASATAAAAGSGQPQQQFAFKAYSKLTALAWHHAFCFSPFSDPQQALAQTQFLKCYNYGFNTPQDQLPQASGGSGTQPQMQPLGPASQQQMAAVAAASQRWQGTMYRPGHTCHQHVQHMEQVFNQTNGGSNPGGAEG